MQLLYIPYQEKKVNKSPSPPPPFSHNYIVSSNKKWQTVLIYHDC